MTLHDASTISTFHMDVFKLVPARGEHDWKHTSCDPDRFGPMAANVGGGKRARRHSRVDGGAAQIARCGARRVEETQGVSPR